MLFYTRYIFNLVTVSIFTLFGEFFTLKHTQYVLLVLDIESCIRTLSGEMKSGAERG